MYYQRQQQAAKLGGLFDQVLTTVNKLLPLALGSLQGLQTSGTGTQAKGLAAIQAVVAQVISGLQQLLASAPQTPQQETIATAQQLAAVLSDSRQVYQAQNGDDAAALRNGKTQAAQLVQQIIAAYQPATTATTQVVTTNASGQIVTTTVPVNNPQPAFLDSLKANPTLLIVGGVGLVAILLAKK